MTTETFGLRKNANICLLGGFTTLKDGSKVMNHIWNRDCIYSLDGPITIVSVKGK